MGAAAVRVVHVPDPRRSDVVAAVAGAHKPATPVALAAILVQTGTSQGALADECGVSRQRVVQWVDPGNEAEPNLAHIRRMPASVRRALGKELVASTEARVLPVPLALYERAALEVLSKVSTLTMRVEDLRASGDERAKRAALQEIHDLRAALDRIERGVLLASKEAP